MGWLVERLATLLFMIIIYISGPMTGLPDYNRPLFDKVARVLTQACIQFFNPASIPHSWSWKEAMRKNVVQLLDCDSILQLEGWEKSKGAMLEYQIAKAFDLEIIQWGALEMHLRKIHSIV